MAQNPAAQYSVYDGDLWPAQDTKCRTAALTALRDLDKAISLCKQKKVAVQAGGNCGVWPRYLAQHFGVVYTFEPDPHNFHCLNHNVAAINVFKFQSGLGDEGRQTGLLGEPTNVGGHRLIGRGMIPVIRLDDLNLFACDFLQLDIEGYEPLALRGAEQTLRKFKPVVMIEQKGKEGLYGENRAGEKFLLGLGYTMHTKIRRDIIFVHEGT